MNKVVTFGEIMLRLSAPGYNRLYQSNSLNVSFAGAEANVAYSIARFGLDVEFVSALPANNPFTEKCLTELRGAKVKVDNVALTGDRIGVLYLETGASQRPSKVYYDRAHSSIANISKGTIDWDKVFDGACWFHWTGITAALSQSLTDVLCEAIEEASKRGITISCDLHYRSTLWKYGKTVSEVMPGLVEKCNVILGNEEDCEQVFGIKARNVDLSNSKQIDAGVYEDVCSQMMQKFPHCEKMAITIRSAINANHNKWTAVLYDGKQLLQTTTYDITNIVDRVGGGDSFMGGLIYSLVTQPNDLQNALDFATAVSCIKHSINGDYNIVTLDEVRSLMKGNGSGRVVR